MTLARRRRRFQYLTLASQQCRQADHGHVDPALPGCALHIEPAIRSALPGPISFTRLSLGNYHSEPYVTRVATLDEASERFRVVSHKTGYAAAGCILDYQRGELKVCAFDEYTGVTIGKGDCEVGGEFEAAGTNALAIWPPDTKLANVNVAWQPETAGGRCVVRTLEGHVVDDEACRVSASAGRWADGSASTVLRFAWPSGSKTVLQTSTGLTEVNGNLADIAFVEGFKICSTSRSTGNRFCFRDDAEEHR